MKRAIAAVLLSALAGCSSGPAPAKPAHERYSDAWTNFDLEAEAMLRAAGRNRLKVEACAGRARAALDNMKDLLDAGLAARVAALGDRFGALSRTIAADGALSAGQEHAVSALRDEVARDFAPAKVAIVARDPEPPQPAPPDAMTRWEDAHGRFLADAKGNDSARLVQDYSEVRDAMAALAKSDDDRFRVDRFLRDYETIAASSPITEQDLKRLTVLAADIRAAFGEKK